MENKNPLIGKTVTDILLKDDKEEIKFQLDNGEEIVARCDADCCSYTYIEDVIDPEVAIGSPVINAVDLDMAKPPDDWEDGYYIQYYGFAIDTIKGRFTIAYRNESNGYYGGNLSWPGDHFYGGVFGQNQSDSSNWISVLKK